MTQISFSDLIGKPFSDKGYGPDAYSCYGLAWEVFRRFGIDLPKTNIAVCACKSASMKEIDDHVAKYWHPIDKPVAPCGLIIRSLDPEYAHHIGVYIGYGKVIHITIKRNVVIDRLRDFGPGQILGYYQYGGNA